MGIDKGILNALADHRSKIRGPHFIFSAERPMHPQNNKVAMNHDQVLNHLFNAGYDAHEVKSQYGNPQRSIVIYEITPEAAEELHRLAAGLGQGHSIYSTGQAAEMRFHHGSQSGRSYYGDEIELFDVPPADGFHTLPGGGTNFNHKFDYKSLHPANQLHVRGGNGRG